MTRSFDGMLVKGYQGKTAAELAQAPPSALSGLSEADAHHLEEAFGITTLAGLASSPYFQRASAILAAAEGRDFDPGPPPEWWRFFKQAPVRYYVEHPSERFRHDFGPVYYRGRLDGSARLLLVGQDPASNEILAQRIFIGTSGQRVQGFLAKLGLTRSYVMLNTFLYSVYRQFDSELRAISLEPEILSFRNAFLDRVMAENRIAAVVAIGGGAAHAVEHWPGSENVPWFKIFHPAARDEAALLASWNQALARLRDLVEPDDGAQPDPQPYGEVFTPEDEVPIPGHDLPFGLPPWHGVGSRSDRNGPKEIIWTAP